MSVVSAETAQAGDLIRHVHPYGFRSGRWARILGEGVNPIFMTDVWVVRFDEDGVVDLWVKNDPMERYEFLKGDGDAGSAEH